MNLGTNISEKRKSKGMTQEELAAKLGVSPQAVSKWENNLSCPDIALLPEIARLFGISVDELLGVAPAAEREKAVSENTTETETEPDAASEEPFCSDKKATKLVITREMNGKVTTIKFPIGIVRFGLNIGGIFGGLTGDQANSVENAIRTGLAGEILSVDGENGEKITISLV
ncbi:MAG: helix-turn-helix transcriptional regulator [Clostridia bacterium]|nr:helix-turn-helix transcriptional regulator [Clostridia bacterium]